MVAADCEEGVETVEVSTVRRTGCEASVVFGLVERGVGDKTRSGILAELERECDLEPEPEWEWEGRVLSTSIGVGMAKLAGFRTSGAGGGVDVASFCQT